jgi:hypothetical protein
MDSTAQTTPVDSKIINENRVAVIPEIINKTASTGDALISQRKEPLWTPKSSTKIELLATQKSSTKLLPRLTRRFDSAYNSCRLKNHHRELSHYRLRNHQQKCFHG